MFPPITTPFKGQLGEGIDFEALEKNLAKYNAVAGISGYIIGGSNSEYVMLSTEERLEIVRQARKFTKKLIVAGCGCESTHHTIELGNKMLDAGADSLLVITPSYFKASMNDRALKEFFRQVAENVKGPIVLYNMPANTGIDMSHKLVSDIVSENWTNGKKNIIGLKDSGGNVQKAAMIKNSTPADFQLISGSFGFLLPFLSVGAVGGHLRASQRAARGVLRVDRPL
jgi:4-hydroxy-2-oxoglutarate aldolase